MRPLVNLASEPFRNRRFFWLIVVLLFFISSVIGFRTIQAVSELDGEIQALEPKVQEQERKARELEKSAGGISAITPEQNQSLQAANVLITRKAFSWSQLLNDLERHIPPAVRVVRISVEKVERQNQEGAGGKIVHLSLDVVGKGANEVTQMIYGLNKSGLFLAEPVRIAQIEGVEDFEGALRVEYRPPVLQGGPRALPANQVAEGGR